MNSTRKIVGIVVIVVVIAIIAVIWYEYPSGVPASPATPGSTAVSTTPSSSAFGAPSSSTVTAVPANVIVPNQGAATTSANIAVPSVQSVGDPSGSVQYRSFNINIDGGAFSPNTVIVNQGDTVNLELTAVDANYGFTQPNYGYNGVIVKGKTQRVQFQALQTGNFTFYCASCGGPSKGPVGHLIVVAKP